MQKRNNCYAVLIANKIYLIGGASNKAVDIFNLDSMSWDRNVYMLTTRNRCCAVPFLHYILVMGGKDDNDKYMNNAELFDTKNNKWTALPTSMHHKRYAPAAAITDTSQVIIAGGATNRSRLLKTVESSRLLNIIPNPPPSIHRTPLQDIPLATVTGNTCGHMVNALPIPSPLVDHTNTEIPCTQRSLRDIHIDYKRIKKDLKIARDEGDEDGVEFYSEMEKKFRMEIKGK